jgi:hypothetical protein
MGSPSDKRNAPSIGCGWIGIRGALFSLIAVRIAVGSLADASLPDPGWIPGIYDEGDFDDVVNQIASLVGLCDWWAPSVLLKNACDRVVLSDTQVVARAGRIIRHDRAPPLLPLSSWGLLRPTGRDSMVSVRIGHRIAAPTPA